jgi:hypothetical protein
VEALDIIQFTSRLGLLTDNHFSMAQQTCLKAIYGMLLKDDELALYLRATGRSFYDKKEQGEATLICGRRAGKTSRVGALIALYEAFRSHNVPDGEHAYVVFIAPVKRQAKIAFNFVKN